MSSTTDNFLYFPRQPTEPEMNYDQSKADGDEKLRRLIDLTVQTNLVALDKTIAAINRAPHTTFLVAAARTSSLAERMTRAVHNLKMALPTTPVKC